MPVKNSDIVNDIKEFPCRPILKWAAGKSQLLSELLPRVPKKYGLYIEPFLGGGALFFTLCPEQAVIADNNPELVSLYQTIADNVEGVIACLKKHENSETAFYYVRSQNWTKMSPEKAAARTIYLNRTCFNGLSGLKEMDEFLKDEKGFLLEIKLFTLEEEYETNLKALLPEKIKDDLIDEEDIYLHERREYLPPYSFRYFRHRPRVSALLKKKIVELTNKDAIEIDAEFIKSLLRTIQYFEDKANKKIQQTRD